MLNFKKIFRYVLPPFCYKLYEIIVNNDNKFRGNYKLWEIAREKSKGYDDNKIIQRILSSTIKVKKGYAKYERDGVLFYKEEYNWPLLTCLLFSGQNEKVNVLDFGGALGSLYFQHKDFLKRFKNVSWNIVEQSNYVDIGKKKIDNTDLKFYTGVDLCFLEHGDIDVVIFSSVLQYLEDPFSVVENILGREPKYIFIDRQPLVDVDEFISIQFVPKSIYKASYPIRFFNENNFIEQFTQKYELIASFDGLGGDIKLKGTVAKYKGFIFKLK